MSRETGARGGGERGGRGGRRGVVVSVHVGVVKGLLCL